MTEECVEVVLPFRVRHQFTYRVPACLRSELREGVRVWVLFGYRFCLGWVWQRNRTAVVEKELRTLLAVVDKRPLLPEKSRRFYTWLSEYYMVSVGEVLQAALPSSLRQHLPPLELQEEAPPRLLREAFAKARYLDLSTLRKKTRASAEEVAKWLEEGVLRLRSPRKRVSPLPEAVCLRSSSQHSDIRIGRSSTQKQVWESYLQLRAVDGVCEVRKIAADLKTRRGLRQLLEKGYLIAAKETIQEQASTACPLPELTTGNKPLVYTGATDWKEWAKWIRSILTAKKTVLWLLPTVSALEERAAVLKPFLGKVEILHGGLSQGTQCRCWQAVATAQQQLVLAVRKGVFLPYSQLDFVLIEEDQQDQFKEQKRSFRYHARDAALMYARLHGAAVCIFSNAPAMESLHKVWQGHYLQRCFSKGLVPEAELLPPTESDSLQQLLQQDLEAGKQVLLFHPHKGYGRYLQCSNCGEVPRCKGCGTVYRAEEESIVCQSCGKQSEDTANCKSCRQNSWQIRGEGTEHLAERLQISYPTLRIGRWEGTSQQMELPEQLRNAFYRGDIQLLLATAHMLYGWKRDWKGVVVLWGCEGWLYRPHYRADEYLMQWISALQSQLSGKNVRLQLHTYSKKGHSTLRQLLEGGYAAFAKREGHKRKVFAYPPYVRLLAIHLSHKEEESLSRAGQQLFDWLQKKCSSNLPQSGILRWLPNRKQYAQRLLLRLPQKAQEAYKSELLQWKYLQSSNLQCSFEVDF